MTKVQVYTKGYCPYCKAAKALLTKRSVPFDEIELKEGDDATWKDLTSRSGMRTVPQIFFGVKLIGGFQQLAELDQKDALKSLRKNE